MNSRQPTTARPWYRLHASTWLIVLVACGAWALILLGGNRRVDNSCEHGWPYAFLRRMDESVQQPKLSLWSWTDHVVAIDGTAASTNAVIALSSVTCLAGLVELRRRRRRNVWQVTIFDLLCAMACVASVFACVANMYRSEWQQRRAVEQLAQNLVDDSSALMPPTNEADRIRVTLVDPAAIRVGPGRIREIIPMWEQRGAWFWETFWPFNADRHAPCNLVDLHICLDGPWPERGIDVLNALPHVRLLTVIRCDGLPDGALRRIGELWQLQELWLVQSGLTDHQLAFIASLRNLRRLDLTSNNITDSGLRHLHGLRRLERLDISNNPITDAGVNALQRALPNLQILDD